MTNPLIGCRFGRLLVVEHAGKSSNRVYKYLCRCDCGVQKVISGDSLRRGSTKSCGCLNREKPTGKDNPAYVHGLTDSPTYRSWAQMVQRCTNANNPKFPRYGARGISVCDKWMTFAGFLSDMGERPEGYTIERKNNDGNYERSNCCWIPAAKQATNRSNNRVLRFNGKSLTVSQWASELRVSFVALRMRLHRGWSIERTLTTPI